ncbi:hypothetical protein [Streptomyces abyssalis]|uniref:hypothetical protein n=1 Tax=Streptomyces abyssalis TaxID=933944 RepID=UPI000A50068E|nr:hypothetical protein [Streptomyces abyssalis]
MGGTGRRRGGAGDTPRRPRARGRPASPEPYRSPYPDPYQDPNQNPVPYQGPRQPPRQVPYPPLPQPRSQPPRLQPLRPPLPPARRQSSPPRHPEVLASGGEGPGIGELWYGLPTRARRTAVTAACLLLLGAGGYAVATQMPGSGARTQQEQEGGEEAGPAPGPGTPSATHRRMPYPAQSARITFDRLAVSDRARRTFTVQLHATATSPLTVLDVGQGYEGVDLSLAGRPPVTVNPGNARTLLLEAKVTNCDGVPLRARSPFLNVTLRNDRARQELSVIPGERYADALAHAFRTLCRPDSPAAALQP